MDLIGLEIILLLLVLLVVAAYIFIVGGAVLLLLAAGILWNKTSRWIPCVLAAEAALQLLLVNWYPPWKWVLGNSARESALLPLIFISHIVLILLVSFAVCEMALQIRELKDQIENLPLSAEDITGSSDGISEQ